MSYVWFHLGEVTDGFQPYWHFDVNKVEASYETLDECLADIFEEFQTDFEAPDGKTTHGPKSIDDLNDMRSDHFKQFEYSFDGYELVKGVWFACNGGWRFGVAALIFKRNAKVCHICKENTCTSYCIDCDKLVCSDTDCANECKRCYRTICVDCENEHQKKLYIH